MNKAHTHTHQSAQRIKQQLLAVFAMDADVPIIARRVVRDVDVWLAGLCVFECVCVFVQKCFSYDHLHPRQQAAKNNALPAHTTIIKRIYTQTHTQILSNKTHNTPLETAADNPTAPSSLLCLEEASLPYPH